MAGRPQRRRTGAEKQRERLQRLTFAAAVRLAAVACQVLLEEVVAGHVGRREVGAVQHAELRHTLAIPGPPALGAGR